MRDVFDSLDIYCGMAFDVKADVSGLLSDGTENILFVWSEQSMGELNRQNGKLQSLWLETVVYLWEICNEG